MMINAREFQQMVLSKNVSDYTDEEWRQMFEYAKAAYPNERCFKKESWREYDKKVLWNYFHTVMWVDVIRGRV